MDWLEKTFKLRERQSSVPTEMLAGATTFMALSYIIFVQPVIMGAAGTPDNPLPQGGILFATCVASAIACLLMAFLANYPIALAPAMGHNAFFAYTVCGAAAVGGMGFTWQQALAAVLIAGVVFVVFSFFGFRAAIMEFIPNSLKRAIAGGIGLLITLIGLEYAGIVVDHPATLVAFGDIKNRFTLLAIIGLGITFVLLALNVRGAILYGIIATAAIGCLMTAFGLPTLEYAKLKSYKSLQPMSTMFALDFKGLFTSKGVIVVILTFLFLDVFDTVGTLVGVSERAGFLDERGRLPRARQALFSDACGTVVGSVLGTSTITSYVESAAGVQAGGRTGLANVATAALLLLSLLLYPLLGIVSSPVGPLGLYPVIAPALIVVGAMMLKSLAGIEWEDPTELLPAFLTLVIMPLAVSITEGIAVGFISYSVLKVATGRAREVHWGFHLVSLALVLRYIFLV